MQKDRITGFSGSTGKLHWVSRRWVACMVTIIDHFDPAVPVILSNPFATAGSGGRSFCRKSRRSRSRNPLPYPLKTRDYQQFC